MHYYPYTINYDNAMAFFYFRQGNIRDALDQDTCDIALINSVSSDELSQSETQRNQFCNTSFLPSKIYRDVTSSYNVNNDFFSYEELMDLIHSTADATGSMQDQTDEITDMVSNSEEKNE